MVILYAKILHQFETAINTQFGCRFWCVLWSGCWTNVYNRWDDIFKLKECIKCIWRCPRDGVHSKGQPSEHMCKSHTGCSRESIDAIWTFNCNQSEGEQLSNLFANGIDWLKTMLWYLYLFSNVYFSPTRYGILPEMFLNIQIIPTSCFLFVAIIPKPYRDIDRIY